MVTKEYRFQVRLGSVLVGILVAYIAPRLLIPSLAHHGSVKRSNKRLKRSSFQPDTFVLQILHFRQAHS